MKTLLSLAGGAVVLTEQAGVFTLAFDEKLSVGGGEAAGIVSVQGQGFLVLSGAQAVKLLGTIAMAHSPASLIPLEAGAVTMAEGAIAAQ